MAGTRGIARFRGEQLNTRIMRDHHFDETNKISEKYLNINYHQHREILEDTKIDVYVQVNDKAVAGLSEIDVTQEVGGRPVASDVSTEGVVLSEKVQIRIVGTDAPIGDSDSDVVYGRLQEDAGSYTLKFFSIEEGKEQVFTFGADAQNIDYRFVIRTNLSVIPVDAIVKGGAGFVEGATDAKAHMNLIQLMKDLYGPSGTLDNDGTANIPVSVNEQIAQEKQDRTAADLKMVQDLAATTGAGTIGVITDPNYIGLTVQEVLTNLAAKVDEANHANDARMEAIELKNIEQDDRLSKLETGDEEEVYEATGGETEFLFSKGKAKEKSVQVFINGAIQAPGINFEFKRNPSNEIIGVDFKPDVLKVTDGTPDVLFVRYKKIQ